MPIVSRLLPSLPGQSNPWRFLLSGALAGFVRAPAALPPPGIYPTAEDRRAKYKQRSDILYGVVLAAFTVVVPLHICVAIRRMSRQRTGSHPVAFASVM
jgi:hypothetical protein